jgi:pyridoxine 5-phosphate synthase
MLSVNIDHIATIRNARNSSYPSLIRACDIIKAAGGEIITIHLREDRRHIKDDDAALLCKESPLPINLEIAPTDEMIKIAISLKPAFVCFVPESRSELTTEGGLNLQMLKSFIISSVRKLQSNKIKVSLFIDPNESSITAGIESGADTLEIHTGKFGDTLSQDELLKIKNAAIMTTKGGLKVHAGHGLTFESAKIISEISEISTLHIGHFLITESIYIGLEAAVYKMKQIIQKTKS